MTADEVKESTKTLLVNTLAHLEAGETTRAFETARAAVKGIEALIFEERKIESSVQLFKKALDHEVATRTQTHD